MFGLAAIYHPLTYNTNVPKCTPGFIQMANYVPGIANIILRG